MGQTYVYNLGSFDDTNSKEISLEVGLFFDGTANNHRNVEIRKKIEQIEEYADQRKSENRATQEERGIYNKYGLERSYRTLWLKQEKTDSSYNNDFSNVARMWRGVEQKNYGIYIEGIGTEDEKEDDNDGLAFGSGKTSIRVKVRKGCEKLADKIKKEVNRIKKAKKEIQNIYVTIDVFGFSRGAAAARNFLYEIGNNKRDKDRKVTSKGELVRVPIGGAAPSIIYTEIHRDKDGFKVNPAYLDNRKMPRMGYLGYYLLQHKLTKAELNKITLKIRFVGLYDTVSSYGKDVSTLSWEAIKHTSKKHLFTNDVEELQLNNFGKPKKVVHFTAMDEHRENFALTKIPKGVNFIEKEFPGVHSDIGGGYNDNSKDTDKPEKITEVAYVSYETAKKEMDKLLLEYWYSPEQIMVREHIEYEDTRIPISRRERQYYVEGNRKIKKEYSYIPLHFMEDFFANKLTNKEDIILKSSKSQYPIDDILLQVENYLTDYVIGNREEKWEFVSDNKLKERKKNRKEEVQLIEKEVIPEEKSDEKVVKLQEVILYSNQVLLRKLRKEYLHRSAKLNSFKDRLAHSPAENRKRKEF